MTLPVSLYRYDNHGDVVVPVTFHVVKHTPHGCWIRDYEKRRFVLNDSVKRFAYPTVEEAKTSFLARKRRQLALLRGQIAAVEGAVEAMKEGRLLDYRGPMYHNF